MGTPAGSTSGELRILLGAEDRELAARLAAQFQELPDLQLVGVEAHSDALIGAVETLPDLDVVLLHQNLGPLPAFDAIRELGVRYPQLAVVLIADEATAEVYAAAMGVGARGVISDDPTLAELQNRLQTAGEWSRTMRRHFDSSYNSPMPGRLGTMLSVCGAKGGTGSTTLAVHLAIAVAYGKRSVCLVDMDLQKGDVPTYLDVQHRRSIADLVRAADDLDGAILSEALFVHKDGPHLLLAPEQGELSEDVTARAARQILAALRSRYDVVIVDCGSHVTDGTATAVELADTVVVAVTPDLPAIRSAKRLTKMWRRLNIRKEEDVVAVLNRHDKRNEIQPDLARKMLGLTLLDTTLPAAFRGLEEAANTGVPLDVKDAAFRKAVGSLTRETGLLEKRKDEDDEAGELARTGKSGKSGKKDSGAVITEFAGIIPLLCLLGLLVAQAIVTGLTSMYASHAVNEAARAVAVLGYDDPASQAEVRERTVARISGRWGNEDHLTLKVEGGYAKVAIDTPFLLPGLRTGFDVTAEAKIVPEGD
ncbi:AAA family ATPase [Actinocorallia aurantiaca]|uniref:Response regulatory domain-containing protein n=1 Tax=Actinocorallia aurantiaca TaxID=46204 RepID=A0ABP6GGS3_9ACTN